MSSGDQTHHSDTTLRTRARSAELPARPTTFPDTSIMTTHHDYTSMNHPQSFATEEEEDVHFYQTYSDGGASGDDYGSASPPQHSPTEDIDFGIPESCRSAILPATFNYSQHDNIGGPQSSPQVQPPHQPSTQLPANKRLKPGRPFNRVSKAGKHHLVTPAGACALLRCSFTKNGQPCTSEASLPSTMRQVHPASPHLPQDHRLSRRLLPSFPTRGLNLTRWRVIGSI